MLLLAAMRGMLQQVSPNLALHSAPSILGNGGRQGKKRKLIQGRIGPIVPIWRMVGFLSDQ